MNQEQSTNLEYIIESIENRRIGTLNFEFPKMYGGWYEFVETTDIGRRLSQSNHYLFRDLYHDRKLKGAFIKLDDETFIQITLLGSERSSKTGICIEIFPVEQLKKRVFNVYFDPDRDVDLSEDLNSIFNLKCFEIREEEKKSKR